MTQEPLEIRNPNQIPTLVRFTFSDEEKDPIEYHEITFNLLPTKEQFKFLNNGDYPEDSGFYDVISENEEKYGVHDLSFSPETEFLGYFSYEVDSKDQIPCVENIRNFFISRGILCSELVSKHYIEEDIEEDIEEE